MKALAGINVFRTILCALMALALWSAPLQFAGSAQAAPTMESMAGADCPEKQSCCDMDKSDCVKAMGCLAKCGGAPGLTLGERSAARSWAPADAFSLAPLFLTPHASSPPRRPPRA